MTHDHGLPFPYELPQRGRVYFDTDVIQGNSGGPTVTATGEVVGIITQSFSKADHYSPHVELDNISHTSRLLTIPYADDLSFS